MIGIFTSTAFTTEVTESTEEGQKRDCLFFPRCALWHNAVNALCGNMFWVLNGQPSCARYCFSISVRSPICLAT